jgi:cell division septation protein DedD
MFSAIKNKLLLVGAALLAAAGVIIKFLLTRNKHHKQEIDTLESNAETQDQIHEADIARIHFEATQKLAASKVNDESKLDLIDKLRDKNRLKNNAKQDTDFPVINK